MKVCPNCGHTYPTNFVLCPQDGQTLTEADVWSEGTVVREKYRILGKVGSGGMATVYQAQHVDFKEVRALKVISRELAGDESFVRRFKQEAVVTRMLHHPNAVRVEDIDKAEDGRPFIVMEYIDGRSLKVVIEKEGPIAVKRACRIAKNVAAALEAAHALGMVHRDIKPSNIALVETASGEQAKVLDFGIAKVKEGLLEDSKLQHLTLTGTGAVVGTPAYMSPEQAKGMKGDQLDGRSDIYSLGVVMYQMLAGELPLKADSDIQMMIAQINVRPPDLRSRRADVPEAIARLVTRCLDKDRDHRPAGGQAFIQEIDYWEEGPARLAREKAEAKRVERERLEEERRAREAAEAVAKLKTQREARSRQAAEAERTRLYSEDDPSASPGRANPIPVSAAGAVSAQPLSGPARLFQGNAIPQAIRARRDATGPPAISMGRALCAALLVAVGIGWYFSTESARFANRPVAQGNTPQASAPRSVRTNPKDDLKYVWIPPGTFMMGCSPGDNDCASDEKPPHQVTITKGFWLGQTPVTVVAYRRFAGTTGRAMPPAPKFNADWNTQEMPIVTVTWDDAQAYCAWAGGRLPTEAEWEYAARGGTREARYGPLDAIAWYADNSGTSHLDSALIWSTDQANYAKRLAENGNSFHEVGQKRPNGFGLFDMLGNVWEWVNDWYGPNYYQSSPDQDPPGPSSGQVRVLRGACWVEVPGHVRVSARVRLGPGERNDGIGFRCGGEVFAP